MKTINFQLGSTQVVGSLSAPDGLGVNDCRARRTDSYRRTQSPGFPFDRQALVPFLRKCKGDEGTDLLEYAIICILLMTLLFGIAGFGHALYAYHFVSNVAREATRWAAVNGSTCVTDGSCTVVASGPDIQTYVTNHTPLGIDPAQITVTPTWPVNADSPAICGTIDNSPGCTVQVRVSYNFNFVFPLIRTTPLPLSSTSQMIIAH